MFTSMSRSSPIIHSTSSSIQTPFATCPHPSPISPPDAHSVRQASSLSATLSPFSSKTVSHPPPLIKKSQHSPPLSVLNPHPRHLRHLRLTHTFSSFLFSVLQCISARSASNLISSLPTSHNNCISFSHTLKTTAHPSADCKIVQ